MPLYEYECSSCKRRSEILQKFSDDPLTVCTDCQGELVRLISSSAIQFKGTGWYVTDYARKSGSREETKSDGKDKDGKDKDSKDKKDKADAGKESSSPAPSESKVSKDPAPAGEKAPPPK